MKLNAVLFAVFIASLCVNKSYSQTAPQLGKNSVKEIIAAMTLEEKAQMVVGAGFSMPGTGLASFFINKHTWIADTGNYTVKANASSTDIRLQATFNLPKEIIVEKVNQALSPKVEINELKPSSRETGYIDELNNFKTIG